MLVFEDMQWADAGLLDFLEYLLEWSRSHPLFVLVLARPELADKRPSLGRRQARLRLALPRAAVGRRRWASCSRASCPACPTICARRILERAEGVPLYAVETVRMLLDRGLLVAGGERLPADRARSRRSRCPRRSTRSIAARLDGLDAGGAAARPGRRGARQDVHEAGAGGAHRAGRDGARAAARLARPQGGALDPGRPALARARPVRASSRTSSSTSPTRRSRKKERKAQAPRGGASSCRRSGSATRTRSSRSSPRTTSTPTRRRRTTRTPRRSGRRAREMLVRAAERAASLAANDGGAARVRAGGRADRRRRSSRPSCTSGPASMARAGARPDEAAAHFERGDRALRGGRARRIRPPGSRRGSPRSCGDRGRLEEGLESMERAFEVLSEEEPDEDLAALAAQLGRFLFFAGQGELAAQRIETALEIAEALGAARDVLAGAEHEGDHPRRSRGRPRRRWRCCATRSRSRSRTTSPRPRCAPTTTSPRCSGVADRYEEGAQPPREGLALARAGREPATGSGTSSATRSSCMHVGRWDEALENYCEAPAGGLGRRHVSRSAPRSVGVAMNVHRGRLDEAEQLVERARDLADSADVQERSLRTASRGRACCAAQGDLDGGIPGGRDGVRDARIARHLGRA